MVYFNPRGEPVPVHFAASEARAAHLGYPSHELIAALKRLATDVHAARAAGSVAPGKATAAAEQLGKTIQALQQPAPDRLTLLVHLTVAHSFLREGQAAPDLVQAVEQSRAWVRGTL